MDATKVESSEFFCTRLGRNTEIDVYSFLRPIEPGTALPATLIRQMQCKNEDVCGIATQASGGIRCYGWNLCPAARIFTEKGTLVPSTR